MLPPVAARTCTSSEMLLGLTVSSLLPAETPRPEAATLCLLSCRWDPNPPHHSETCFHGFLLMYQGCLRVHWVVPYCFSKCFSSSLRQCERRCTPSCMGIWWQLEPVPLFTTGLAQMTRSSSAACTIGCLSAGTLLQSSTALVNAALSFFTWDTAMPHCLQDWAAPSTAMSL